MHYVIFCACAISHIQLWGRSVSAKNWLGGPQCIESRNYRTSRPITDLPHPLPQWHRTPFVISLCHEQLQFEYATAGTNRANTSHRPPWYNNVWAGEVLRFRTPSLGSDDTAPTCELRLLIVSPAVANAEFDCVICVTADERFCFSFAYENSSIYAEMHQPWCRNHQDRT